MANDAAAVDVHVSTRGAISDAQRDLARDKIARLVRLCREPVRVAQVRLVIESGPARDRPAEVEAVLDIDGKIARAHVAAASPIRASAVSSASRKRSPIFAAWTNPVCAAPRSPEYTLRNDAA